MESNANDVQLDKDILDLYYSVLSQMNITKNAIKDEAYKLKLEPFTSKEFIDLYGGNGLPINKFNLGDIQIVASDASIQYKGRPVLVYQRDQFLTEKEYNEKKYRTFHLCMCKTLREAQASNRYENRYVMTLDTSGIFTVNFTIRDYDRSGRIYSIKKEQNARKPLRVCKNCLKELNWNNLVSYCGPGYNYWKGGDYAKIKEIVNTFSIEKFFHEYLRKGTELFDFDQYPLDTVYSATKKEPNLSSQDKYILKKRRGEICARCGRRFTPSLLEIHHRNHNEGDNRSINLQVLCKSCHAAIHDLEGGYRNLLDNNQTITFKKYADINMCLGEIAEKGLGRNKNSKQATEYYKNAIQAYNKAADNGDYESALLLFKFLRRSKGNYNVKKIDDDICKKLANKCRKLSNNNNLRAKLALSEFYRYGIGVIQDDEEVSNLKNDIYSNLSDVKNGLTPDDYLSFSMLATDNEIKEEYLCKAIYAYEYSEKKGDVISEYKRLRLYAEKIINDDEIRLSDVWDRYKDIRKKLHSLSKKYCSVNQVKSIEKANIGEIVEFGRYPQGSNGEIQPLQWIVLDKNETELLILSKYGLDCKKFHTTYTEKITWASCYLRGFLNNKFIDLAFNEGENAKIILTHLPKEPFSQYNISPGPASDDMVFLLSYSEAEKYYLNSMFEFMKCETTKYAMSQGKCYDNFNICQWWLRSQGVYKEYANIVRFDGQISHAGVFVDSSFIAIRPAMKIKRM